MAYPKLSYQDLLNYRENKVGESRNLEYKREFKSWNDSNKKELLADIVSFANSDGGTLVFGVEESKDSEDNPNGIELVGLADIDIDETIRRVENMLRDCVKPRLPSFETLPIHGDSKVFIALNVPKSYLAPHAVKHADQPNRFYARNSAGKFELDVDQLREAFLNSNAVESALRGFRLDRIATIARGDTPVLFEGGSPRWCVHLQPLRKNQLEPAQFKLLVEKQRGLSLRHESPNYRYNLDGFLIARSSSNPSYEYRQVFRNGSIEYASSVLARYNDEGLQLIPLQGIEDEILSVVETNLHILRQCGIVEPCVVSFAVTGVQRCGVAHRNSPFPGYGFPKTFDHPQVVVPELLVGDEFKSEELIPLFDMLWQAAGYECSPDYDSEGQPRKRFGSSAR